MTGKSKATDGALTALARAYDKEDASQRGEPDPWADGGDDAEWVSERLACAQTAEAAYLAALPPPTGEPDSLVKELREEAERLSGHSLDRGVQEAGIAANLANRVADTIESLLATLKTCVESMSNDHPGSDEYWRAVAAAEAALEARPAALPPPTGEPECATEGCGKPSAVHFIRGNVGSYYCADCYKRIHAGETERLASLAAPLQVGPAEGEMVAWDRQRVCDAAQKANYVYQQWMPQQWIDLFIKFYEEKRP